MNSAEHIFSCLAEECSEISEACCRVAVRVSKALRFGPQEIQPGQLETNAQRIADELADLLAVAEMLEEAGIITRTQVEKKKDKILHFMAYARECGALE